MTDYSGLPCLEPGCPNTAVKKGRCVNHQHAAFAKNYRKERLPKDWAAIKNTVLLRDKRICQICFESGADGVDHIIPNDDNRLSNLRAVHHNAKNSKGVRCHNIKSSQEGNEAKRQQKPQRFGSSWERELRRKMTGNG